MATKSSSPVGDYSDVELAVYRKIRNRIIPILFICYVLAYLDRVNVGFAKLQMQAELHMSDAVYGVGAGVFFIGYFFFEVPANIALQKIGAFAVSAIPGISGALSFIAITSATAGIKGTIAVFWTLPTGMLSSTAAAAGIAWINSVGNLAGYVSPSIIGKIRDVTHNMTPALLMLSCFMLTSSIVVACLSQRIIGGTLVSAAAVPPKSSYGAFDD